MAIYCKVSDLEKRKPKKVYNEYRQCKDCKHRYAYRKLHPIPCDSCEQSSPTNFEEI